MLVISSTSSYILSSSSLGKYIPLPNLVNSSLHKLVITVLHNLTRVETRVVCYCSWLCFKGQWSWSLRIRLTVTVTGWALACYQKPFVDPRACHNSNTFSFTPICLWREDNWNILRSFQSWGSICCIIVIQKAIFKDLPSWETSVISILISRSQFTNPTIVLRPLSFFFSYMVIIDSSRMRHLGLWNLIVTEFFIPSPCLEIHLFGPTMIIWSTWSITATETETCEKPQWRKNTESHWCKNVSILLYLCDQIEFLNKKYNLY